MSGVCLQKSLVAKSNFDSLTPHHTRKVHTKLMSFDAFSCKGNKSTPTLHPLCARLVGNLLLFVNLILINKLLFCVDVLLHTLVLLGIK